MPSSRRAEFTTRQAAGPWLIGALLAAIWNMQHASGQLPLATSLTECQEAVVQLIVYDRNDRLIASGTAFLIDGEGRALTNHHVIEDAASVIARTPFSTESLPVELLRIIPDLDLALLRLPTAGEHGLRALRLEYVDQPLGTRVYAIGFPKNVGMTMTSGIVSGYRRLDQLPWRLDGRPSSRWVQTDCVITNGNSGGPLVDEQGSVIGVNTWMSTRDNMFYFALAAEHILEILGVPANAPIDFDRAGSTSGASGGGPVGPTEFSLPRMEIELRTSGSRVIGRTVSLDRDIACRRCDGAGAVTIREQVGLQRGGAGFRNPIIRQYRTTCPMCRGRKLKDAEVVTRLLENLARDVARMRQDGRSEQAIENMGRLLPGVHARITHPIRGAVNAVFEERLKTEELEPGDAVVAFGTVQRLPAPATGSSHGDALWVVELGERGVSLVLTEARMVSDGLHAGNGVMIGGLFAGRGTMGVLGESVPVLQGGFIVRATR